MKRFDGYTKADFVDRAISVLLKQSPPNENAKEWLIFCRTVKSSLDLIEGLCLKALAGEE